VLVTGEDRLLRSQSRFMIESPDKFLAQRQADGLSASTARPVLYAFWKIRRRKAVKDEDKGDWLHHPIWPSGRISQIIPGVAP
jgi:hypothetical protein